MNSLVKRAKCGDAEAFIALIEACKMTLQRVALGYLKNEEDAADAIQDTILDAYEHIRGLKKEGYFKIIDMIKPAEIVKFVTNVITTGDEYSFNPVTGELLHEMHGERYQNFDNILGSYAYIKFANGFESIAFLTKEDLIKIKDTSPSGKTDFSPWNSQSLKMVKTKTVKELAKELCTLWSNKLNSIMFNAVNSDEVSVKEVDSKGFVKNDNSIYNTTNEVPEAKIIEKNTDVEPQRVDMNEL